MELATLGAALVDGIQGNFSGDLYRPGDAGYDEARMVINSMIDRRPALVARPAGEQGVQAIVNLGRGGDGARGGWGGGGAVCALRWPWSERSRNLRWRDRAGHGRPQVGRGRP